MDESLRILAEKQECPTDIVLVQQVRLQLISEKVAQGPWQYGAAENTNSHEPPPAFYLQALQSQVIEAVQKAPPELQHNGKWKSTKYFLYKPLTSMNRSSSPAATLHGTHHPRNLSDESTYYVKYHQLPEARKSLFMPELSKGVYGHILQHPTG